MFHRGGGSTDSYIRREYVGTESGIGGRPFPILRKIPETPDDRGGNKQTSALLLQERSTVGEQSLPSSPLLH